MKRLIASVMVICALFSVTSRVQGDQQIPEELAKLLNYYVGQWTVSGKLGDTPIIGKASFRMPPGGHCLLGTVSFEANGETTHFSLVTAWDSSTDWVTEQGAGSDGSIYQLKWRKVSETVQEGDLVGTLQGKRASEKNWLERKGDNECVVVCTERMAGDERLPDLTLEYTRVPRERGKRKATK
jgi:hypothetical protein